MARVLRQIASVVIAGAVPLLSFPSLAVAAPAPAPIGHLSLATQTTPVVASGMQEAMIPADFTTIRTTKASSLKTTAEGATDTVVAYDDVTGSIGGMAYVAATNSPTGAPLYITAPKTSPMNRMSPNGPGAITTLNASGVVISTQYVPSVLPGPAGCVHNWGDGSAPAGYKTAMKSYIVPDTVVSTCATPIGKVAESYAPGDNVVDASSVVGIGDLVLSPDGKSVIAANANDGHLYSGPIAGSGELTRVASLPGFATSASWRPYGLSNHNGQTLVGFTEIGPAGSDNPVSYAMASYDSVKDAWKTVMDPVTASGVVVTNPGKPAPSPLHVLALKSSLLSGISIDSAGSLEVTFLNVKEASRPPSAGLGATPVLTLVADGVDHWTNALATAPVIDIANLTNDNNLAASFGHIIRSPIANKSVLTTEDPGLYNSSGLGWLPDAAPSSGTSQVLQARGTVTDPTDSLWVGSVATNSPVDPYAFGKSSGIGELSDMASYAEIGDRTWIDTNANGIQDAGEPSLAGVVLEVKDKNGNPIIDPIRGVPAEVVTDANGRWTLVIDAEVVVQVCISASNYTGTGVFAPGAPYAGYGPTTDHVGTNPSVDSNADGTKCLLAPGGQKFPAGTRDYTYDAGFVFIQTVVSSGTSGNPTATTQPPTASVSNPPVVLPTQGVPSVLPATGSRTSAPLTLAVVLVILGGSFVLISRRRPIR